MAFLFYLLLPSGMFSNSVRSVRHDVVIAFILFGFRVQAIEVVRIVSLLPLESRVFFGVLRLGLPLRLLAVALVGIVMTLLALPVGLQLERILCPFGVSQ